MTLNRRITIVLLSVALAIDLGLLAYWASLSLNSIDALWQIPFLFAYPAAFLAGAAFLIAAISRPISWRLLAFSVAACVTPLALLSAANAYVFL